MWFSETGDYKIPGWASKISFCRRLWFGQATVLCKTCAKLGKTTQKAAAFAPLEKLAEKIAVLLGGQLCFVFFRITVTLYAVFFLSVAVLLLFIKFLASFGCSFGLKGKTSE